MINEVEIVVMPKMEMSVCVRQTTRKCAFRQEYITNWSKRETVPMCRPGIEEWIMREEDEMQDGIHQAEGDNTQLQSYKRGLEEKMTSIKQKGRIIRNAPSQDNTQLRSYKRGLKEKMTSIKQRGEGATQHSVTEQHPTAELQERTQGEDDIYQAMGVICSTLI